MTNIISNPQGLQTQWVTPSQPRCKWQERAHMYQLATGIFYRTVNDHQVEIQLVFVKKGFRRSQTLHHVVRDS